MHEVEMFYFKIDNISFIYEIHRMEINENRKHKYISVICVKTTKHNAMFQ